MLPLRDDIPADRFPAVTVSLIIANVLVFMHELRLGDQIEAAIFNYALIPARYAGGESFSPVPFLTSMFLHGGWIHLIGNMWTLWIFGDNVEDRLGHGRFLLLYLIGGFAAGLLHVLASYNSPVPTIGASGAVAAVMGSYFRFYPHARVHTVIPPFFLGPIFELPAVVFLGWWLLLQFFNGSLSLGGPKDAGGVAWWAHVGGFVFGMAVSLFAAKRARRPPPIPDEREDLF
jgi:membrane associated rhomboid family serine protease